MKKTCKRYFLSILASMLMFVTLAAFSQNRREAGNMVLEDIPEVPGEIKDRLHQYLNSRSAGFADWLPGDAGMLISTRFGNTQQLHTVAFPGASRQQITYYNEPVRNGFVCHSPDHHGFLFPRDTGGNEFMQIYWYDMNQRQSVMISDGESVNHQVLFSNEGNRFAFTSTRRNMRDFDIYISDMKSPKQAELLVDRRGGYWLASDWSPDDSKILVNQYLSVTHINAFIVDSQTGSLQPIGDSGEDAVFSALAWNHDASGIYLISDKDREFNTLGIYDLSTGEVDFITNDILWDVNGFALNSQRTKAAFTVNENGFSRLYLLDTQTHTFEKVENLPEGQLTLERFHPERDELAMTISSTQIPGDIYSYNLTDEEIKRWTYSEVGGLNTSSFPVPELFTYETFDSISGQPREIPAFAFNPVQDNNPIPVLIFIHGGPEAQYIPSFSPFTSYLVEELGIAVIAPNVRGSSGYGKTYVGLDDGYLREHSVKDIGSLIDWIAMQPEYDANRIGVIGASYGGYMVLASMFHFNDKLRCGVNMVGISNFVTFLENTQEYRRDLRRAEYGDERDPEMREFLLSISPVNHAHKIRKPLFVIQGANDPRVPASESEQMVEAIRQNDGKVWYMLALNEGHGFQKKENRDHMHEAIAYFLKLNLLPH